MNIITRTVAEFETGDKHVGLSVNTTLTWDEWEQLVKAVEGERKIRIKITKGFVLPGDWVGGFIASGTQEYSTIQPDSTVKREMRAGWRMVYEGTVKAGDLMYKRGTGWVEATDPDIDDPINEAIYGVQRREDRA